MFSRKMECGIPIGRRFFMAPRRIRLLTCLLPSKRIFPPFFQINVDYPAFGGLLAFKTNILEISGIPQRIKVALDGCRIVDVTRTGKYTRADGFSWNAPVPMNVDVCNQLLLT